ncbi:MAG: glycosyltransferase family 2 protein [Thermosipho sp. (in: Bacteria)]|nr:glycosyltransferase family 2 protein [Thermosipho sp. (in: thermotogales)]
MLGFLIVISYFVGWFFYINFNFLKSQKTQNSYKVSVIIPARNEEKNIRKILESLKNQNYPIAEIIVVDDNSKDNTAKVAKSFENVKVVTLKSEPPEGWLGKPWACWNGYKISTGDILIFIDADVELSSNAIESLLAEYEKNKGLISVWPYQRFEKGYEHFNFILNIAAVFSTTILKLFGKTKPIGAFGPLVLTSREDYTKVGGHFSVKGEIVEDLRLGQIYLENGLSVNNFLGYKLVKFRMYPKGFKEMLEGMTKNMAIGLQRSSLKNTLLILIWYIGVLNSIPLKFDTFRLLLYTSYVVQFYFLTKKVGDYNLLDALLYPVHFVFFIFTLLDSIFKTVILKKVSWKDREIVVKTSTKDE